MNGFREGSLLFGFPMHQKTFLRPLAIGSIQASISSLSACPLNAGNSSTSALNCIGSPKIGTSLRCSSIFLPKVFSACIR
jgi:hypothetical protein